VFARQSAKAQEQASGNHNETTTKNESLHLTPNPYTPYTDED
jgi:hypothetical protein